MPFAGNSRMMVANGTIVDLASTFVSDGTTPAGSTWQMVPTPGYVIGSPHGGFTCCKHWFEPPCYDPLRVPEHLEPGEYVLGFRWDCESSAQVWQSCADVKITTPSSKKTGLIV